MTDTVAQKEAELFGYQGDDRVVFVEEVCKIKGARKPGMVLKSGIPRLDKLTEGFETGQLITVVGITGHGKTTLCETIAQQAVQEGIHPLFFSYEIPIDRLVRKYPVTPKFLTPLELSKRKLDWIADRAREAKLKYDCRIVFIDHLGFIVPFSERANTAQLMGEAMRFIKTEIALGLNMIVFVCAHMEKIKLEKGKRPGMEHIRDSSAIPQESDKVLIVHRKKDGSSYIYVDKDRQTGVMNGVIRVRLEDTRLVEVEEHQGEPPPVERDYVSEQFPDEE